MYRKYMSARNYLLRPIFHFRAKWLAAEGDRHRALRDWAQAARYYQQALQLNPRLRPIWVQLGHALKESGSVDAALDAYRRASELPGTDGDAPFHLGLLERQRGHVLAAAAAFAQSIREKPENPDASRELRLTNPLLQNMTLPLLCGDGDQSGFCADKYLEDPDIALSGRDPYEHFMATGFDDGRTGTFFDGAWYVQAHKDVADQGLDPLRHYNHHGKYENRDARFIKISSYIEYGRADYSEWVKRFSPALSQRGKNHIRNVIKNFQIIPKISVVMPVYNTPIKFLSLAIESVLCQTYENFEICIADDCSPDAEVRNVLRKFQSRDNRVKVVYREVNGRISLAKNSAIALATGDFVAFLDHDDLLSENALFWVAHAINVHPSADLIYSDEDKFSDTAQRFDPHFKPDFNYELFLAQNMIGHLGVYRHSILKDVGCLRKGLEGAQDYDLALRFVEKIPLQNIVHIPRVLYHWRATEGGMALSSKEKDYAFDAGAKAVRDHLARTKRLGSVTAAQELPHNYRVRYDLTDPDVLVSIIIPTKDNVDILKTCISSIINNSTYRNFEIIVIDNGSVEKKTFEYFNQENSEYVKIIRDDIPFNFSRLNNLAFEHAKGEQICLMNNDIEVITPDWLEEMISFSQHGDVGCVGARLWYPDDTLQHGGVIIGLGGVAGHSHKHLPKGAAGYAGRAVLHQALSAVTAACLMVKSSVFREVNGFDEKLAIAFNDVDFCLRVREAGYRNVWTPYAEMYHHESASRGLENTPEKIERFNGEIDFMKQRWGELLKTDPYYSPNLTIVSEDFSYAFAPRVSALPHNHSNVADAVRG